MERDKTIDILRGIAMILVVMGHCGAPFSDLIYSFHVPLFFILSGYLYKGFSNKDFFKRVKKKIYRLYMPCMLMSVFLTFANNSFIDLNILCTEDALKGIQHSGFIPVIRYSLINDYLINILKAVTFTGGGQLSGALWFLRVMFISLIIFDCEYMIIYKFVKRKPEIVHLSTNLILSIVGYALSLKSLHIPGSLEVVCSILLFYNIGIFIKQIQKKMPQTGRVFNLIVVIIIFSLLMIISNYEIVDVARNKYTSPILLIFSSVLGFIMSYNLSKLFSNYRWSSLFSYIGKNTVAIICWHFLAFKIVNYIVIKVDDLPSIYIARFPIIDESYWLLYTLAGVLVPLLFVEFYLKSIYLYGKIKQNSNTNGHL